MHNINISVFLPLSQHNIILTDGAVQTLLENEPELSALVNTNSICLDLLQQCEEQIAERRSKYTCGKSILVMVFLAPVTIV